MNLLRTLATVSSMTLLSRILGFVRDFVIARTFGASTATDAFVVAFKLPNLLRRMFAEGAFSQAFVPVLAEYRNERGEAETRLLVDRVASVLALLLVGITLLGVAAAPVLVYLSAPGFSSDIEKFALAIDLTRLTFPYIFFMSLVALSAGVLNTWSRFTIPAFTPVLLNVSLIILALLGNAWFDVPVMALGWAVIIGGLLQLALQVPALARIGMLPRWRFEWRDEGVRRIARLMAPAMVGVSVSQISLIINTVFASFLVTGSVSWLYYADRLMEFPSGLLGAALGTILLPSLSRLHAQNNFNGYSGLLDWGLRLTLLLALPATLALGLLALPLIATLFMHGAFTPEDVRQTSVALIAYSIGLPALILVKILAPGFYARQNIRTPVKIALISLALTQAFNLILIGPLQHAGLALAISLAGLVNAGLLFRGLRQHNIYTPAPGWRRFLLRLATALAVLALTLCLTRGAESFWLTVDAQSRILRIGGLVALGMAIYFSTLWLVGFRLHDFSRRVAN